MIPPVVNDLIEATIIDLSDGGIPITNEISRTFQKVRNRIQRLKLRRQFLTDDWNSKRELTCFTTRYEGISM
jgi:hypothetical protein